MEHERREQATPATPILDSILGKLPPPSIGQEHQMRLKVTDQAYGRLSKKIEAGTLTQKDIEDELSSLPAVPPWDVEQVRTQLVRRIQMNVPAFDIKELPAE